MRLARTSPPATMAIRMTDPDGMPPQPAPDHGAAPVDGQVPPGGTPSGWPQASPPQGWPQQPLPPYGWPPQPEQRSSGFSPLQVVLIALALVFIAMPLIAVASLVLFSGQIETILSNVGNQL
jgi:hypothetical protein